MSTILDRSVGLIICKRWKVWSIKIDCKGSFLLHELWLSYMRNICLNQELKTYRILLILVRMQVAEWFVFITIKSTMFESSNSSNRLIAFLMYVYLWIIPGRSRERALQNLPSSFWSTLAKTDSCKNIELLGGNLAVLIVRASMEPLERRVPVVSSTRFINFLRLVSLILPHCAVKFHRHKNFTL